MPTYVQLQYPLPNDLVTILATSEYSFSLNVNAINNDREKKREIIDGVVAELEWALLALS